MTGRPAWQIINAISLYQEQDTVGFTWELSYSHCFVATRKKRKNLQPNGAANTQRMIQETIVGQTTAKKSSFLKMTKVFQK